MDKQNYNTEREKKQELKEVINKYQAKIVERLKNSGILKRKRKLKSYELLFEALKIYVLYGLSYRRLANDMAFLHGVAMSPGAWKKQLFKASGVLLDQVIAIVRQQQEQTASHQFLRRLANTECYAIDATDIASEGNTQQIMRVHTLYSITGRHCPFVKVTDNHTAESVRHYTITEGSLYLADRCYGRAAQLSCLLDHKAHFIVRITPRLIRLYRDSDAKQPLDVKTLLTGSPFVVTCWFRYRDEIYPIRLAGIPLPQEKRYPAEARARRSSARRLHRIQEATLLYSQWTFFAVDTAIEPDSSAIYDIYSLRWQIELFFKRAKSLLHFHRIRAASPAYRNMVVSLWIAFAILFSALASLVFPRFSDFFAFASLRDFFA